ncbi:hypothetical protein SK128_010899 [Halocaridina rubra]|uniref:Uncharacterized protein n=1 Tax=Halocaridina rubra TaxID=373956 RepID=A0AAN9ACB0_HALRR
MSWFIGSTRDVTRFTILLNNMRLMGILDWWIEVLDFIYKMPDNPLHSGKEDLGGNAGTPAHEDGFGTSPLMFTPSNTPLLKSPQTQSPPAQSPRPQSPFGVTRNRVTRSNTPRLNPMVESTGVMTKHDLILESSKVPFELKLNITDSELVVVENTAIWDTSAVILKVRHGKSSTPEYM